MRRWLQGIAHRARLLWQRALSEHSSPREIGWSIALGVFAGCTPLVGLHMWLAIGLATLLRVNRLWAFVGSRLPSSVLLAWIAFLEIELAHRLRVGAWTRFAPREVLAHGREFLVDWFLGSALVGAVLGAALGAAAYVAMRRWRGLTPHMPHAPRPPTSESPRSAPPAPTP